MRPPLRPFLLVCLFAASATLAGEPPDSGRFVVHPPSAVADELRELAAGFHRNRMLEALVEGLNARFVLPREIGLRLLQCDAANAWYDPQRYEVLLCLELVGALGAVLRPQFADEAAYTEALAGAFIATALHEVGHALVHVLELPITGREEDAVDQLAAWLLIGAGDANAVLGAAAAYYTEEIAHADQLATEHSLDRQRYFNHVCWVYGAEPDDGGHLISDWQLPPARAEQCEAEYRQLDSSWSRLLQGHLRGVGAP
jgi:hypothetical protein